MLEAPETEPPQAGGGGKTADCCEEDGSREEFSREKVLAV